MNQCDTCGGWFGLTAWTCAACYWLAHGLLNATQYRPNGSGN